MTFTMEGMTETVYTDDQVYTASSGVPNICAASNLAQVGPQIVVVSKTESTCGPTYFMPIGNGPAATTPPATGTGTATMTAPSPSTSSPSTQSAPPMTTNAPVVPSCTLS